MRTIISILVAAAVLAGCWPGGFSREDVLGHPDVVEALGADHRRTADPPLFSTTSTAAADISTTTSTVAAEAPKPVTTTTTAPQTTTTTTIPVEAPTTTEAASTTTRAATTTTEAPRRTRRNAGTATTITTTTTAPDLHASDAHRARCEEERGLPGCFNTDGDRHPYEHWYHDTGSPGHAGVGLTGCEIMLRDHPHESNGLSRVDYPGLYEKQTQFSSWIDHGGIRIGFDHDHDGIMCEPDDPQQRGRYTCRGVWVDGACQEREIVVPSTTTTAPPETPDCEGPYVYPGRTAIRLYIDYAFDTDLPTVNGCREPIRRAAEIWGSHHPGREDHWYGAYAHARAQALHLCTRMYRDVDALIGSHGDFHDPDRWYRNEATVARELITEGVCLTGSTEMLSVLGLK